MAIGRVIDRIGHLQHRLLKILPHSANQLITIQSIKPIHGKTPPGLSKPEMLFNHHDGKIGRPINPWVFKRTPLLELV
jgi:hypothetical protein